MTSSSQGFFFDNPVNLEDDKWLLSLSNLEACNSAYIFTKESGNFSHLSDG